MESLATVARGHASELVATLVAAVSLTSGYAARRWALAPLERWARRSHWMFDRIIVGFVRCFVPQCITLALVAAGAPLAGLPPRFEIVIALSLLLLTLLGVSSALQRTSGP